MKESNRSTILLSLLLIVFLQACSGGSSSSVTEGLSCEEIALNRNTQLGLWDGQIDNINIKINNDCSFTTKGDLTGTTVGNLTSKDGNTYKGRANNANLCTGPIYVTVQKMANQQLMYLVQCEEDKVVSL